MRILIEGPKFSGKSTLSNSLMSAYPSSTRLEVRCFFNRAIGINKEINYYYPGEQTGQVLSLFVRSFQAMLDTDDIILERFHLFDWVQHVALGDDRSRTWNQYEQIDQELRELGFKLIILVPDWECLRTRADNALNQDITISKELLRKYLGLYKQSTALTKLPTVVLQDEYFDAGAIINWVKS